MTKESTSGQKPKIYLIAWQLLGEWWHADKDCTEEEILVTIRENLLGGKRQDSEMQVTINQVKQRLYGGFGCDTGGIHIFHQTGRYTYLGENGDIDPEARQRMWKDILKANAAQPFDRSALFTDDCPK